MASNSTVKHPNIYSQPFQEIFKHWICQLQSCDDMNMLRIPSPGGEMKMLQGKHFHYLPEMFIQLGGVSEMNMPDESIRLTPGEICIVPPGVPHDEYVYAEETPFSNLVVSFRHKEVALHVAGEARSRSHFPSAQRAESYRVRDGRKYARYCNDMIDMYWLKTDESRSAVKGLMLAFFAEIYIIMVSGRPEKTSDHPTIAMCKQLVEARISDAELNVASLARRMHCSADYLSHFFRKHTGQRLKAYINSRRLEMASEILKTANLTVSEIARICGYSDPGYFIRLFRKHTGKTPLKFRTGAVH